MLDWFVVALKLAEKIIDRMPKKKDKLKDEYFKAKEAYMEEMAKNYDNRSDARVDVLRNELCGTIERLIAQL